MAWWERLATGLLERNALTQPEFVHCRVRLRNTSLHRGLYQNPDQAVEISFGVGHLAQRLVSDQTWCRVFSAQLVDWSKSSQILASWQAVKTKMLSCPPQHQRLRASGFSKEAGEMEVCYKFVSHASATG